MINYCSEFNTATIATDRDGKFDDTSVIGQRYIACSKNATRREALVTQGSPIVD